MCVGYAAGDVEGTHSKIGQKGIKAASSVLYRQSAEPERRNSKRKKRDGRGDPRPGLLYLLSQKQETSDGCLPPRGEGQINRGLPNTCVGIIVYRTPSQARGKIQMGTMIGSRDYVVHVRRPPLQAPTGSRKNAAHPR